MQKLAWFLIGVSFVGLMGWGIYAFFAEDEVSMITKIAIGALGVGFLILLGIALRDRLSKKEDEFKDVDN